MGEMYWLSVHLLHMSSINKRSAWVVATFKSFRIIMVVLYLVIQKDNGSKRPKFESLIFFNSSENQLKVALP